MESSAECPTSVSLLRLKRQVKFISKVKLLHTVFCQRVCMKHVRTSFVDMKGGGNWSALLNEFQVENKQSNSN